MAEHSFTNAKLKKDIRRPAAGGVPRVFREGEQGGRGVPLVGR